MSEVNLIIYGPDMVNLKKQLIEGSKLSLKLICSKIGSCNSCSKRMTIYDSPTNDEFILFCDSCKIEVITKLNYPIINRIISDVKLWRQNTIFIKYFNYKMRKIAEYLYENTHTFFENLNGLMNCLLEIQSNKKSKYRKSRLVHNMLIVEGFKLFDEYKSKVLTRNLLKEIFFKICELLNPSDSFKNVLYAILKSEFFGMRKILPKSINLLNEFISILLYFEKIDLDPKA
jgi:hypothetical protein